MLKVSVADICDRYTINRLKIERLGIESPVAKSANARFVPSVSEEFKVLEREIKNYRKKNYFSDRWLNELYIINGKIWDLEADIRKGKERQLGLEDVGRRAIAIRDLNKSRIAVKNLITKKTRTGFTDVKVNHASA